MSTHLSDQALDALLATYRPPGASDDMAARVAARATASPQHARIVARGRRARAGWARRPLIVGTAMATLAVSSAVAASLAGLELPQPVERVIAELPLIPDPTRARLRPQAEVVSPRIRPESAAAAPTPTPRPAEPATEIAQPARSIDERIERASAIVAARRAADLPTPRADRLERARELVEERRASGLPTPLADRIKLALDRRRELERNGVDPAEMDQLERNGRRAAIRRRLVVRAELVPRAQAGDSEAAMVLERLRQRRRDRLEGAPDAMDERDPTLPGNPPRIASDPR